MYTEGNGKTFRFTQNVFISCTDRVVRTRHRQCTFSVILRYIRVTIVAVERQNVSHVLSVCVALVFQHAKSMRRIILSCVTFSGSTIRFHIISKTALFLEGVGELLDTKCVFFLCNFACNIQRDIVINVKTSSRKICIILVRL